MANKILSLSVFKKRPVLVSSIVVIGGLIVYFMFFRGGDNSPTESVGYGDANVNAASGLAAAQMQSQLQGQQIQGQLAALQIQGANDLAVTEAQTNLQRDLAAFSYEAAKLDNARDIYGLQVQERIETLGMQTSSQIEQLRVSSELEALKVQANRDLMQQKIMTEGQLALSEQAASISRSAMSTTVNLQKMAYDTQIALGAQDLERTKITVGSAAKTQQKKDKSGMWVSLAGMALSFFCDRNIKSIDKCVSNYACLRAIENMPIEFWHYLEGSEPHSSGDTAQHVNTYAQDFYRELGADDWNERKEIAIVDYMGAQTGAIKALSKIARPVQHG